MTLRAFAAPAAALLLAGCDLLQSFPTVQPDPIRIRSMQPIKVITANVAQRGSRITDASLKVDCVVSVKLTPTQSSAVRRVTALQGPGQQWVCTIPEDFAVRRNQVLQTFWRVSNADDRVLTETPVQENFLDCDDPVQALRNEQSAMTRSYAPSVSFAEIVDGLNRLDGEGNKVRDGQVKWIPTHGTTSFAGMGVAFIRSEGRLEDLADALTGSYSNLIGARLGRPDLLLYAPLGASSPVDVAGPDDPYRLIGWAYAETIPLGLRQPVPPPGTGRGNGDDVKRPELRCVPYHAWFVHAAGWHRANGTFAPAATPFSPTAADLARGLGQPPPVHHPNLWDIHFFAQPNGVASIGITGPAVPGIVSPADSFFHPVGYD